MAWSETSAILIVDDDRGGREALEAMLLTQGYTLLLASNGPEALRKLTETPVDLLLLDVMMPGMDGYEVCRRIRATPAIADVPVLMLTALNDYRSRLAGFEAGADDYISKPFDSTELFARVRTITRLNRYRRLVAERLKFQQLFALSPNGQIVADATGAIRLINQKTLDLLNIGSSGEIEGSPLTRWITEEDRSEFQAAFEKCLAQPSQSFQLETGLVRADSQSQPVELLVGCIEYSGQIMVQVIMVDIRERLQMAGALSRERILLRTLVDSLPDYFYVKDTDSHILMVNSAMSCMFGFDSPDDMIGKTDFDIFPTEVAQRYMAEEKQILATGRPVLDREEPLVDAAGNWLVFSTTKVPLYNLKNEIIGLMGIGRDVTTHNNILRDMNSLKAQHKASGSFIDELKHALAESEQEKKLAVANIGALVGSLAQQIAQLAAPGQDPAALAASIQSYADILLAMAADISEFGVLDGGEPPLKSEPFSIPDCIQLAVGQAAAAAAEKGLTIKVEIDSGLPRHASGDGKSLERVFLRLLQNAIRVSRTGEISIHAGLEYYGQQEAGSALYFHGTVSDCGKIIPKQEMPGLLLPFHPPITGNGAATGLGLDLAICRLLVQRVGGGIWAENKDEPVQGSIIHFSYQLVAL